MKQASFPASQTEAAVLDRHDESSSRAPGGGKRPIPRWVYAVAVGVGLILVGLILAAIDARPWIHARALAMLRSRFQGQVEIADFHIAFFPIPTVTGRGVVVRHHGRTDVPPL